MSDIGLDFAGLMALIVILAVSVLLLPAALITFVVSFGQSRKNGRRLINQKSFGYFGAAISLLILNVLTFVSVVFVTDHIMRDSKVLLDNAMLFGWLPLNLTAFFIVSKMLRRKYAR